ncbi:hypothetical protein ACHWQZ_G002559 [Mnemiopsis leidyi]
MNPDLGAESVRMEKERQEKRAAIPMKSSSKDSKDSNANAERKEIYEIYEKNEIYALYEIYEKQASTHETMKSNRLRGETESVAKTEQGKNDREMFKHFTDACK